MTQSCHECPEKDNCLDLSIIMDQDKMLISTVMRLVDDIHRRCIRKFLQKSKEYQPCK